MIYRREDDSAIGDTFASSYGLVLRKKINPLMQPPSSGCIPGANRPRRTSKRRDVPRAVCGGVDLPERWPEVVPGFQVRVRNEVGRDCNESGIRSGSTSDADLPSII